MESEHPRADPFGFGVGLLLGGTAFGIVSLLVGYEQGAWVGFGAVIVGFIVTATFSPQPGEIESTYGPRTQTLDEYIEREREAAEEEEP